MACAFNEKSGSRSKNRTRFRSGRHSRHAFKRIGRGIMTQGLKHMERRLMNNKSPTFNLLDSLYSLDSICLSFAPIALIVYYSFFDLDGQFHLSIIIQTFFHLSILKLTISSFWYAFLITFFSLLFAYPTAYLLTKTKHKQLWLLLIIIPSWINLLLKTYAFIGFSVYMVLLMHYWKLSELASSKFCLLISVLYSLRFIFSFRS